MIKRQSGQTLLEILLAFGVSVTVLGAIVLSVVTSLNKAQYTKNQNLANSYAQEGMAVVRSKRSSSWKEFSDLTGAKYCVKKDLSLEELSPLEDNCTGAELAVGPNEIFSREAIFEHESDSCRANPGCTGASCLKGSKVTVKVLWTDNKCGNPYCHKVELITCLFDLSRIIPTSTPGMAAAGP